VEVRLIRVVRLTKTNNENGHCEDPPSRQLSGGGDEAISRNIQVQIKKDTQSYVPIL
jgi:hypothetical protein